MFCSIFLLVIHGCPETLPALDVITILLVNTYYVKQLEQIHCFEQWTGCGEDASVSTEQVEEVDVLRIRVYRYGFQGYT